MTVQEAVDIFSAYQKAYNSADYARQTIKRVEQFVAVCTEAGAQDLKDIRATHIRAFLRQTPKAKHPGAWRDRYNAVAAFLHYMVLVGELSPEENPLNHTPVSETLTNKKMLTWWEVQQIVLATPNKHTGIQDRLCVLLLWHGKTLREIQALSVESVADLPAGARELAERLLQHRGHSKQTAFFLNIHGEPQAITGQVINRRLKKYAAQAGIPDTKRLSARLVWQSGHLHRLQDEEAVRNGEI